MRSASAASRRIITTVGGEIRLERSAGARLAGRVARFVRERVPKTQFHELSKSIPNADYIMRETHMRGIVTGPLDDIEEYEKSLASLGIGQPLASQFAPAVVEYLGSAGFHRERAMLASVLD